MYIVDETMLKVGSEYIWLWIAIEPENKQILALYVSKERNMFVAEHFLLDVVHNYGIRTVFQPMVEPGTQWLVGFKPKSKTMKTIEFTVVFRLTQGK